MGRDKGNRSKTKPSSKSEASELLYYSQNSSLSSSGGGRGGSLSGSYNGLLGSMSAVMGLDAALSGELQIIFKKLYKPSVVTKLKALEELCAILGAVSTSSASAAALEVFDIDDEASVGALLETFGQLYPRLATDPERGIRERSSGVLSALLCAERGVARRCLGRHIKAVLPAWLCAMNDPAREVAACAAKAFSVLPPAGQAKAVAFAEGDVAAFLKEALLRSLAGLVPLGHPQTRDDKTAVQDQIDRTFPMYLGAVGTVVRILLLSGKQQQQQDSVKTRKAMAAAALDIIQTVFPAPATWATYFGNKNPAARKAAYKLLADLAEVACKESDDNDDEDNGGKEEEGGEDNNVNNNNNNNDNARRLLVMLGMEATDAAPMSKLVLVNALGEKDAAAQSAMWGCVLGWLRCMGDAAWAAVAPDLRKAVLPRVWALLRASCHGAAPEAAYPCLLVFLSLVPAHIRTEGAEAAVAISTATATTTAAYSFYGSFFGAFWEGLCRCALDSVPGSVGSAPVAAAGKSMCECLRFALHRDAQQGSPLEAALLGAVLEPLLLAALCDARFRTHARALAAEAADTAARILESRAGTPAAAELWGVLTDAVRYALGAIDEYPRSVPGGIILATAAEARSGSSAELPCGIILKRIAQQVKASSPEKDALLAAALGSAIDAARGCGCGGGDGGGSGTLDFVEQTVLPLCPRSALPDLRANILPWLQTQLLMAAPTANSVVRLCVAATRTSEDWEALLSTIQSVAQTPEAFAECLVAAAAASSEKASAGGETKDSSVFHSHPELVGMLLLKYIEEEATCGGKRKAKADGEDKHDSGYAHVTRALSVASAPGSCEPFVDSVSMEAIAAILLDALESRGIGAAAAAATVNAGPFGLFLLGTSDIVVRFFLSSKRSEATNTVFPLLARIFVSSADANVDAAFRDKAFTIWEQARPAISSSSSSPTENSPIDTVARLFFDAVVEQQSSSTEAVHKALGRHVRSLVSEGTAFLSILETEVAACETPLCQMYAPHLLYYDRRVSAPVMPAGAPVRQMPPQLNDKALQTYRLAFAAARELPAPLPQWLLIAAALVRPVAEIGCYEPFSDLGEEAHRILLSSKSPALFEQLVAKARATRESGANAMYALAADLVCTEAPTMPEHGAVSSAFSAFFLSSDFISLQYADGAFANFEALAAAMSAASATTHPLPPPSESVVSTAKRLADELISRDFFGLGAQPTDAAVLCRTLGAVASLVRLGAYGASDLASLAEAIATRLPSLALGSNNNTVTSHLIAALRLLDTILSATTITTLPSWDGVQRAFSAIAAMSPKQQNNALFLQGVTYAAKLAERSAKAASGDLGLCAGAVASVVASFPRSGARAELVHAKCAAQALYSLYGAIAGQGKATIPADSVMENAGALLERVFVSPAPRVQALAHRILCDGLGAAAEALGPQEDIPEEDLTALANMDPAAATHMPAWISDVLVPALARALVYPNHALGGSGEILPDSEGEGEDAQFYDVPLGIFSKLGKNAARGGSSSSLSGSSSSSSISLSKSSGSSSSGLSKSLNNNNNNNATVVRSTAALDYGCMLTWSVVLHVAARLHPSRRPLYALAVRSTERIGTELLQLLHYSLPEDRSSERPVIPARRSNVDGGSSSSSGSNSTTTTTAAGSISPVHKAITSITDGCGDAGAVVRPMLRGLAAELLLEVFQFFPTLVRLWYVVNNDHRAARAVEAYVRLVNPILCECQLGKASGRVVVEYENEDIVVRAAVVLPELYPLVPPMIESVGRAEGLDDALWRKWQMGLNSLLASEEEEGCPDGLAKRAAERWTDSLDKHFDGIEPCPICYSVFASNGHLPTLKCRVCKHKFHSSCMFKWFSTSHKTTCPLCKSDFAIKGFN